VYVVESLLEIAEELRLISQLWVYRREQGDRRCLGTRIVARSNDAQATPDEFRCFVPIRPCFAKRLSIRRIEADRGRERASHTYDIHHGDPPSNKSPRASFEDSRSTGPQSVRRSTLRMSEV
jgi:hypothetical protein